MGGVELLDLALFNLRPVISGKKWYQPLVINGINITFVCSWWLYRVFSGKTIPQKDFRRHIVGIMIRQSKPRTISVDSRLTKAYKVTDKVRNKYPSAAQSRNLLFVGYVAEIHVRSGSKVYVSKYIPKFSMNSDNTMTLLPEHVLYSLSKKVF